MSGKMKSERVNVLKYAFYSTINIALLWLSLSPEDVWNLFFFNVSIIIFKEKVPAERRFHVVNKSSFFIQLFFCILLFFSTIRLSNTSFLKVVFDYLFYVTYLFAPETLQKNIVFDILKNMRINASQFFRGSNPCLTTLLAKVALPNPHTLH